MRKLQISTKGRYGLRALVDLAKHAQETPIPINHIAVRQDISERYLEQLMAKLKKAELVKSVRGANGGYILGKASRDISVGDVLRALEGNLKSADCKAFVKQNPCESADECMVKFVWQKINDSVNETVDKITIEQLLTRDNGRQDDE